MKNGERLVSSKGNVSSNGPRHDSANQQPWIGWNETATNYPRDYSVHHLFQQQVSLTPDAVALIDGVNQLTYSDLNDRANRLARYLARKGVGPETVVGIA